MSETRLPPMRTLKQAYETIRETDPASALTMTALRRLVVSGKLPSVRAGSKYLLNLRYFPAVILHKLLKQDRLFQQ